MSENTTTNSNQPNITFAIIKNDAVKNGVVDQIIETLFKHHFRVIHRHVDTTTKVSMAQTVQFYYPHIGRDYFPNLIKSLHEGCIPLILEDISTHQNAVTRFRKIIGATNSRIAEPGTIRAMFGGHLFNPEAPVAENAIHGSDSLISALNEIKIIFPELTTINSIENGAFELTHFQVGDGNKPLKLKILQTEYNQFLFLRDENRFGGHGLGRAFYDHFKLYESILKDNTHLSDLCNVDDTKALKLINELVDFI